MKRRVGLRFAIAFLLAPSSCDKSNYVEPADYTCAAGEYSCQVQTLRICNDSRTGWIDVGICAAGTRCDALAKSCVTDNTGGTGGSSGAGGAPGTDGGVGGQGEAGTAGQGGTGTAGSAGDGGPECVSLGVLEECRNGLPVARVVTVAAGPPANQIDATEVTRSQYAAWIATAPSVVGQKTWCSGNQGYEPDTTNPGSGCDASVWPPGANGNEPVVCIDWCDAYAYCQAIGKRLCGRIGGGSNLLGDFADASRSQWYNACSSNGSNTYPYGNAFGPEVCNGAESGEGTTLAVATKTACQPEGPFAGVYDLSGNVWEFEDSCDSGTDSCRIRGGSFRDLDTQGYLRCDHDYSGHPRNARSSNVGFRCCGL